MAAYLAKNKKNWSGFAFAFWVAPVWIYFILIARALNTMVINEKKKIAEKRVDLGDAKNDEALKEEILSREEKLGEENEWSEEEDEDDSDVEQLVPNEATARR